MGVEIPRVSFAVLENNRFREWNCSVNRRLPCVSISRPGRDQRGYRSGRPMMKKGAAPHQLTHAIQTGSYAEAAQCCFHLVVFLTKGLSQFEWSRDIMSQPYHTLVVRWLMRVSRSEETWKPTVATTSAGRARRPRSSFQRGCILVDGGA